MLCPYSKSPGRRGKRLSHVIAIAIILSAGAFAALPGELSTPVFYQKSALEQQTLIWNEIERSAYPAMPAQDQAPDNNMDLLSNPKQLVKVFQYDSPVMPPGRAKATHQFGAAAMVVMEIDHPELGYTGAFKTGALGILRLSLAKANPAANGSVAFIPNLSLKILRDHHPDTNILAMHSVEGQGKDPNFFKHTLSNFPGPAVSVPLKVFSHWLSQALGEYTQDQSNLTERARIIPLAEASLLEKDGTRPEKAHAPYEIIFKPNPEFHAYFQTRIEQASRDHPTEPVKAYDFRKLLGEKAFDDGEVIFDLYVRDQKLSRVLWDQHWSGCWSQLSAWWKGEGFYFDEPITEEPLASQRIGRLRLKSRFIASEFGDQLPFRHPTIQEPATP